ncbi:MAG: SpoIID/LytB domain-containing protein [Synergistaceae bacterium]|jgi:stage II sporulation protein D|nr:SpoIID/LytB domain-containing protein [Synergistaceae bacterium]
MKPLIASKKTWNLENGVRLLLLTVVIAGLLAARAEAVQNFNIKIGIADGVKSGKISGKGLVLTDAKGTKVSLGDGSVIAVSGNGISAAKKNLTLPVRVSAKGGLGWENVRYRGSLSLVRGGGGFTVVNELDLESYLRGILKMEMNPEWPFEALKAQAILARTYAAKNRGRFAARGYDLDATENSQVYRGVNAEDPRTDRAVAETKGMVLTWSGATADIFYHSDSGGSTADVSHVWGGTIPYLKTRAEPVNYTSPYSTWQATVSAAQISSIMSNMGKNVGRVSSVEVAQRDSAGRAIALRVTGDLGSSVIKAHAFRMAAGSSVIRSTNFNISGASGTSPAAAANLSPAPTKPANASQVAANLVSFSGNIDPLIEMTKGNVFTNAEMLDMLMNPDKREEYLKIGFQRISGKQTPQPAQPPQPKEDKPYPQIKTTSNGSFVFSGKGWGHGVGLSQWGAKAMAENGSRCEDILAHYFPGTKIGR